MICSSLNLLFLMSAILRVGGLLLLRLGMAGRGQVMIELKFVMPRFIRDQRRTGEIGKSVLGVDAK